METESEREREREREMREREWKERTKREGMNIENMVVHKEVICPGAELDQIIVQAEVEVLDFYAKILDNWEDCEGIAIRVDRVWKAVRKTFVKIGESWI